MHTKDYPFLAAKEGRPFLRDGVTRIWLMDDLQSFTPLRFMPPELMGYRGRAVLIDPDIFAVGDITELLGRDMQGMALMCRGRASEKKYASSVMLLDCAKLTTWHCEQQFEELFQFKRDYMDWISLKCEPEGTIGLFEEEWNHFDTLNDKTKLLHNTKRKTQPWKTGLPVDFIPAEKHLDSSPFGVLRRLKRTLAGKRAPGAHYVSHPDPNQERFFFNLLAECLDRGIIGEEVVKEEMRRDHVRHDALEVVDRVRRLAA